MSPATAAPPVRSGVKTIALVDFSLGGHHAGWLLHFAETLLRLGHRVVCICPDPAWAGREMRERHPAVAHAFSSLGLSDPAFPRVPMRFARVFAETVARWRHVATVIANQMPAPPDLVCFAMLDNLLAGGLTPALLDRIFPYQWTGVLFHPRAERLQSRRSRRPRFLRNDYCAQTSNCKGIAILDEGIAEKLQQAIAPTPVIVFPDFIIPAPEADAPPDWIQALRRRAGSRTMVGCLGALNPRKGVFTLLRIAMEMDSSDLFFVFAGNVTRKDLGPDELRIWDAAVAHPPENCAFHLSNMSDVEFDAVVANCDVIYAAYRRFPHSSNLLGKAAKFSKPVIVSTGFCMEERVRRFSMGIAVREDDAPESLAALKTLRAQLSSPDSPYSANGFAGYLEEHSTERLTQCLDRLVSL